MEMAYDDENLFQNVFFLFSIENRGWNQIRNDPIMTKIFVKDNSIPAAQKTLQMAQKLLNY